MTKIPSERKCVMKKKELRKHPRDMIREVFIDHETSDYTMIKVTGPDHAGCAETIVRNYHADKFR